MKHFKTILLLSALLLLGCKADEMELNAPEETSAKTETTLTAGEQDVVENKIRVKLTSSVGDKFAVNQTGGQLRSSSTGINEYLQQIGAASMTRVFPNAGKFEERTRREGLHLWYDITFDTAATTLTRAATDAKNIQGVEVIEKIPRVAAPPHQSTRCNLSTLTRSGATLPFNDPMLASQWHYNNDGSIGANFVRGADINLFPAWETVTGTPDVIVAIVDGGIDVKHEDLKESMWINQAELNGESGVDSDGNGYIDDIYGYNFVYDSNGKITPDPHGTHVAGTIAARNNNGVGVCGVAGGDGTPQSGVRLMSCQIFEEKLEGNPAAAIKYGADNGAVICQNSWGFTFPAPTELPRSLKESIDYFIKYAGCDNQGNQLPNSPMKGGVVFFAAGNEDREYDYLPGSYPPVIAVSSMSPAFRKAYYTNRGDWVDVMAPGGDAYYSMKGMVLSTEPDNTYALSQGTSMACPHVSGIAGLIVSKYGGKGYTNEQLKQRILSAIKPIDINKYNPGFEGKLGRGYIDATKAVAENENKAPGKIENIQFSVKVNAADISWNAVSDEDDGTADCYLLYVSDKKQDINNYATGTLHQIQATTYTPGDAVNYTVKKLKANTTYYFALVAKDRWGLLSPVEFFSAKTRDNKAPGKIELLPHKPGFTDIELKWKAVTDADDGTAAVYKLYYNTILLSDANYEEDGRLIEIPGTEYKPGETVSCKIQGLSLATNYFFALVALDVWEQPSPVEFFRVSTQKNTAPILKRADTKDIRITGTETARVKVLVEDPDKQEWTYTLGGETKGVMVVKKENNELLIDISAVAPAGKHTLAVHVADAFNATATLDIPFEVYENHPPKQLKAFQRVFVPVGKKDYPVNLAEYFADEDGHAISYSVHSADASIAGARIEGDKLLIDPLRKNPVNIQVVASDTQGAKAYANIPVQVVADDLVYIIYPVPVATVLNVRLSDEVRQATLSIRNTIGAEVYKQEITATTPEQRMLQLDLSKLSGGSYILHVDADGKTFKQSFIKR